MKNLSNHLGEMTFDGLIIGLTPAVQVDGGIIRKLSAETTLVRGTILAKSDKDNKLVVLGTNAAEGEKLTPNCVLCDDITVGTAEDESVAVYTAGCFNLEKVTVADGYTITEGDKDELRIRNIAFKSVTPAN